MDPRLEGTAKAVAADVGLDPGREADAIQLVMRLLFSSEEIEGERFEMRTLRSEGRGVGEALTVQMGRPPSTWEFVGRVVAEAQAGAASVPTWTALLRAYERVQGGASDDSLSPQARLADQALRIATPLCQDGCRGCLHSASDIMDDALVELTTSRGLLQRYWAATTGA
jgi:hypothetical protein